MRILLASVTNKEPEILGPHLESVLNQVVSDEIEVDAVYIRDGAVVLSSYSDDITWWEANAKPASAEYSVNEDTHHWTKPTFYWLAQEKQRLIDHALKERYDAIWFVDSDLVCSPDTLASLIASDKPIVSAVFWTKWTKDAPPLPQVWMTHPYEFQGRGVEAHEFIKSLRDRQLIEVGGLGACTLIRSSVLNQVGFWPLIEGLPEEGMWQGEDRHFCVRATRSHIPLYADAWPDIFHVYRDSDVANIPAFNDLSRSPRVGDLVSFVIEPIEEPQLAGFKAHARGRLGAINILPVIERALMDMVPGDERFVKIRFPMWWKLPEYRGQVKSVYLRLLGVKDGAPLPPTLSDFEDSSEFVFDPFYEG
jgi:GT2 family glycosyltransferase